MNDQSFFSIDRLVEFGMSLAIARQMVKTMNDAMTTMYIPGAINLMQQAPPAFYYVMLENRQTGPISEQELSILISERKITKETYIWKAGMLKWEITEKLPEVLKLVALAPPPFQPNK